MLFVLHYIMVGTVYINNSLVDLVYTIMGDTQDGFSKVTEDIDNVIINSGFFRGWGALIVYVAILGVTVAFFVQYIKRFFTIGFLVAISPLITVTYSIDKMGAGKLQALNTWLKEFIFNIIIQPFHCIIYAMMCSTAIKALAQTTSLKNFIVAIMSVLFVFKAEDIIKNIFGFRAGTLENAAASGALAWGVMSKFQSKSQNKNAKAAGSAGGGSSTSDFKCKDIPQNHTSNPPSGPIDNTKIPSRAESRATTPLGKRAAALGDVLRNTGNKISDGIANSGAGSSAFAEALAEKLKNNAERLEQFSVDPNKVMDDLVAKGSLQQLNNAIKITPKIMTGAFVSGLTGSAAQGIAAGYITGPGYFGKKFTGKIDKDLHKLQENAYNNRLANAMDNYRIDNDNMSDEEIYNKCLDLYEKDIATITDPAERQLAKRLQELKKLYEDRGEGDPAQRVMHQVEKIQAGNVRNAIKVRTENIVGVATTVMGNMHLHKDDMVNPNYTPGQGGTVPPGMVDRIIDDINHHARNGSDYFNSNDYSNADEDYKMLAREIYTSKSMMSAIGTAPQARVDAEIKRALREQL